jgi:putative FmdB family regulatory protein
MPTYVYACSACNTTFEAEQRITEDALDTCNCGSKGTVKRVIQPVGISFKGSGFHINDYSSSSSGSPTKDEATKPAAESSSEPTTPAPAPAPAPPETS